MSALWYRSKSNLVCLDSRIESLQLTMTEVLKRQCSKSKKSYNQVKGGLTHSNQPQSHTRPPHTTSLYNLPLAAHLDVGGKGGQGAGEQWR